MNEYSNVIVIADDMSLRISVVEMIQRGGLQTRAYDSAAAFLATGMGRPAGCFLLDLGLPKIDGSDFQAHLKANWPDAPVIFVSQNATVSMIVQAMRNGAYDVIEPPLHAEELVGKVKAAIEKFSTHSERRQEQQALRHRIGSLTARERQILELVLEGISTKEMGRRLGISPRTVEVHRSRIMRKMELKSLRDTHRIVLALRAAGEGVSAV